MNPIALQLAFNGDRNTAGRQDKPINFSGNSNRRSRGLPAADPLNAAAAAGSAEISQIMANENDMLVEVAGGGGLRPLYMGDSPEKLDILKYPCDSGMNHAWVLLTCVILSSSEVPKIINKELFLGGN